MSTAKKTKPELWSRKVAAAKAKFGKWSARAAQWATSEYKKAGGGYSGAKKASNSLSKWTKQKWRTRDGKPAKRKGGTARYLRQGMEVLEQVRGESHRRKETSWQQKGQGYCAQYSES